MPKQQVKCSQIHFRCETAVKERIERYVEVYNQKHGHIQKTNVTEVIEIAVEEYIRRNSDTIPRIDRGQSLW